MRSTSQNAECMLAFIFGVVFVVVMLAIALFVPNPTPTQWFTFRVVLALAAAGVGAMLPGLISVNAGTYVKAGGALALFVLVFWFNPAKLVTNSQTDPKLHLAIPSWANHTRLTLHWWSREPKLRERQFRTRYPKIPTKGHTVFT